MALERRLKIIKIGKLTTSTTSLEEPTVSNIQVYKVGDKVIFDKLGKHMEGVIATKDNHRAIIELTNVDKYSSEGWDRSDHHDLIDYEPVGADKYWYIAIEDIVKTLEEPPEDKVWNNLFPPINTL